MRRSLTRRNFLRGAGGVAVALPFLESIGPARAGGEPPPRRYLQFMHSQGMLMDEWAPSGTAEAMVLSNQLSPLEPVRDRIVVVSGCENPTAGEFGANAHISSARTLFTCAANSGTAYLADGPSIDQVIADRLAAPVPYKSLQFGIGGNDVGENQLLYAGPADPVPVDGDPVAIFDQLFADLANDPSTAPSTMQRLRARRQSVLDTVLDQFDATMGRASAADRQTLERHAEKIRELETQLGNQGNAGSGCGVPLVELPPGYQPTDMNQDQVSSRVFIDLMVMALACDMTRVGTLQYTHYHDASFQWLGVEVPGVYNSWHEMVHEIPNMTDLSVPRAVYRWYMEEYAYLLQQLAEFSDGDGSLLDNMLVISASEFGDGAHHSSWELPIVLAGGLGGAFTTGRHASLPGSRTGELFVTFLQWMGASDTVFGNPAYCDGPLSV